MKIVYIAKFKRVYDEEPIAKGFEQNGIEVIRLEEGQHSWEWYLERVKEEKPDLVLCTKLQIDYGWRLLGELRELKIPSVSWTFDLLLGHPPREKEIKSFCWLNTDYVFLTDGGHEKEYKELGINKYTLRQGIPEVFCYMAEPDPNFKYDIVFVGTHNPTFPYRQGIMTFLQNEYKDKFHWYGFQDAFEIRGHELNKLYANAKIVIGDSMFSPNYWSNRMYEALGRGAFLISPDIEGIKEEFEPYKEFIPYTLGDVMGLKEKIDYFLKHDELRQQIRAAGHKRVKEYYLYSHRCKEFLKLYAKISQK